MNTLHLKYAVEVEKTNSITQAADNLFMAQPNLSKAIKELEDNLGFSIFERTSKGVIPTKNGARFLVYAKNILEIIEKMNELSVPDKTDTQNFSISIPRSSFIWECFNGFADNFNYEKALNINIKETNAIETIDDVSNGKFNLGIIRFRSEYLKYFNDYIENRNLSSETLCTSRYTVVTSQNSDYALQHSVTPSQLSFYTQIMYDDRAVPNVPASEQWKMPDNIFSDKCVSVYDRSSKMEMLSIIRNSFTLSGFISADILERYQLCSIPIRDTDISFCDLFIYRKKYQFSDLDKEFRKELDSCITKLS